MTHRQMEGSPSVTDDLRSLTAMLLGLCLYIRDLQFQSMPEIRGDRGCKAHHVSRSVLLHIYCRYYVAYTELQHLRPTDQLK